MTGEGALGFGDADRPVRLGLISDTHGKVPARIHDVFDGVDAILHAGDIGSENVLAELSAIAPVVSVLGNMDAEMPAYNVPTLANVRFGGVRVLLVHDRSSLARNLIAEDVRVVVYGHSHIPRIEELDGVLWVNPGAVFRPRHAGEASVALMTIEHGEPSVEFVPLG